jgi:hypothetical protein
MGGIGRRKRLKKSTNGDVISSLLPECSRGSRGRAIRILVWIWGSRIWGEGGGWAIWYGWGLLRCFCIGRRGFWWRTRVRRSIGLR